MKMGRLKRKCHKKHRKELGRRPQTPASDPESCATLIPKGEDQYSSCTYSCDESLSLSGAPITYGDGAGGRCVVERPPRLQHGPADEMEVTRKLSCLNFTSDMLPGSAHHRLALPIASSVGFEVVSDGGCSELTSATQQDLLPALDSREGMEAHYRANRKRPSRRKTNRRAKKFRYINTSDRKSVSMDMPLPPGLGRVSEVTSGVGVAEEGPKLSRTCSLRRAKRSQQRSQEDDPLLCCFSDTSVVVDVDTPTFPCRSRHHVVEEMETTPPAMELNLMCDDTLPNESELSESTSDSGCEGDDEESSVEFPANAVPLPRAGPSFPCPPGGGSLLGGGGWWEAGDPVSLEEQRFQQLLQGSLSLLSSSGRCQVEQLGQEFKHPGRFGVCGGRSRKKRCKPADLSSSLTLKDINQKIAAFVKDASLDAAAELRFSFVSRAFCKTIAALAGVYRLECAIEQKRRLPVATPLLRRTRDTRLATTEEIEPILRQHGREGVAQLALVSNRGPVVALARTPTPPWQVPTPPRTVGAGNRPLDESNVGNRMLQGMGWMPGVGLGAESDGITSPVKAYLRTKRTAGLGFIGHH